MAAETNDGLITEPTLHLCLNEHAIRALATAARKSNLQLIAEQIERQLLPARVEEEPIAFGSVVKNLDGCLFVRLGAAMFAPWGSGDRRYQWADLHVIEVLRVGVGEPTPEQVAAASAPEWARIDASNAESDAIDALVQECYSRANNGGYGAALGIDELRALAADVLEVGGQQPGVPVTDEMVAKARKAFYGEMKPAGTFDPIRAALEAVLLPKEPTS